MAKNESNCNIIHSKAFHAGRKRPEYKPFFRHATWPDDNGETNGFCQGDCLDCPFHCHVPDIGATELNSIHTKPLNSGDSAGKNKKKNKKSRGLPIPDHTAEAAFATMCLHHIDHPLEMILEIKRILKPGGRIVLIDLEKHDFDFFRKEENDRWQGFYFSDIRQMLSRAGFSNIIIGPVAKEKYLPLSSRENTASLTVFIATGTT